MTQLKDSHIVYFQNFLGHLVCVDSLLISIVAPNCDIVYLSSLILSGITCYYFFSELMPICCWNSQ